MESYAIVITVGPVSAFIGAGRRSRDLWYGSQWLTHVVARVGRYLLDKHPGSELVQPSPERLNVLREPPGVWDDPTRNRPYRYRASFPNKLEALLVPTAGARPADVARAAFESACEWFHGELEKRLTKWVDGGFVDGAALARQLHALKAGDFIEYYAGWAHWPQEQADPVDAKKLDQERRDALEAAWRRVGARKNTRLFPVATFTMPGRPKSHLDPGRDTILREPEPSNDTANFGKLRLLAGVSEGEQLDAIGLARRLAVFRDQDPLGRAIQARLPVLPFPPISRVAADPWLRGLVRTERAWKSLESIRRLLDHLSEVDRAAFWAISSPAWDEWDPDDVLRFPFDASILLEGGLEAAKREFLEPDDRQIVASLEPQVRALHALAGAPHPYYALLTFDGDGVGQALAGRSNLVDRKSAVQVLEKFSDEAAQLLFGPLHRSCPIFVGGDEGLAYVPLDKLIPTVRELHALYARTVAPVLGTTSLSFGALIAHVKFDLRSVRRRAEAMLKTTKEARTRQVTAAALARGGWLALQELPRAGSERQVMAPLEILVASLEGWATLLRRGDLALALVHDLGALADRYRDRERDDHGTIGLVEARALAWEKAERNGTELPPALATRLRSLENWSQVDGLVAELLIASGIAKAQTQAGQPVEQGEAA